MQDLSCRHSIKETTKNPDIKAMSKTSRTLAEQKIKNGDKLELIGAALSS
jgi:hypothetical protein